MITKCKEGEQLNRYSFDILYISKRSLLLALSQYEAHYTFHWILDALDFISEFQIPLTGFRISSTFEMDANYLESE